MEDHGNETKNGTNPWCPYIPTDDRQVFFDFMVLYWVIFVLALPGICFALHRLSSHVNADQVAPVYVRNLLVSDIIQISANAICTTLKVQRIENQCDIVKTFWHIYMFGVQANVFYMMYIAAERYIMIAHAFWYVNIQNIRTATIVSVTIWTFSAVIATISLQFSLTRFLVTPVLLLPYLPVLFFFVGSWRVLSRTTVPPADQRRVMAVLALVLCMYTVLFLPAVWVLIVVYATGNTTFTPAMHSGEILAALNPLFDLLLYVFMRRDAKEVCKALMPCCQRSTAQSPEGQVYTIQEGSTSQSTEGQVNTIQQGRSSQITEGQVYTTQQEKTSQSTEAHI
ncbi:cysteinyl leukotriene receptor 2-like [Engraulis encrasicolus]|uniref:cysteinyl leukotriene receptor 2-like n=1 Tax=Engraulis encrasicolus TaxID=184585 RepID=UPI002FD5288F